jgi:hypothetical protein
MAVKIVLSIHFLGIALAGVMIYFLSPWLSTSLNNEVEFTYLVLYSLLGIWSYLESKKILKGQNKAANELTKIIEKEDN